MTLLFPETLLTLRGLPVTQVYQATDGPPVVESPSLREPTSLWDLIQGTPVDRRLTWDAKGESLVLRQSLHSNKFSLSCSEAREIKAQYWGGKQTGSQLAKAFGVSRLTVWRIVHGLSYWWA